MSISFRAFFPRVDPGIKVRRLGMSAGPVMPEGPGMLTGPETPGMSASSSVNRVCGMGMTSNGLHRQGKHSEASGS